MFGFRHFFCLKSKGFVPFGFFRVRISDRNRCPKFELFGLDFRHCLKSELSGNGIKLNCLKSKLVWISDIHCTTFTHFLGKPMEGFIRTKLWKFIIPKMSPNITHIASNFVEQSLVMGVDVPCWEVQTELH